MAHIKQNKKKNLKKKKISCKWSGSPVQESTALDYFWENARPVHGFHLLLPHPQALAWPGDSEQPSVCAHSVVQPTSKPAEHPLAVKGRVWGSWWSCRETHRSAIRIIHYRKEFYHKTGWSGSSWNFHLVFAMTCDDRELAFLNSYYLQRDFLDIL